MTKKQIEAFVKFLREQVVNHSIYMWGGQGEKTCELTVKKILTAELSVTNAKRVVRHIADLIGQGYDMSKSLAFDCSGLGVYWLLKKKLITSDMTADMLYRKTTPRRLCDLKTGDLVFKIQNGKAVHVGYIVDQKTRKVVEAYGRDVGVVERTLGVDSSEFTVGGTLNV